MEAFFANFILFFKDMVTYSMIAIFLENTIFARGLGASTMLFAVRKKMSIIFIGITMTIIITISSIFVYFLYPIISSLVYSYYIIPIIFVAIIGIAYVLSLIIAGTFLKRNKKEILSIIHVSGFNCVVLGALLLSIEKVSLSLGGYIGFGIGTGIGFTLAAFLMEIAYEKLSSNDIPAPFRGFPITIIYIGIVSLAIHAFIGEALPF